MATSVATKAPQKRWPLLRSYTVPYFLYLQLDHTVNNILYGFYYSRPTDEDMKVADSTSGFVIDRNIHKGNKSGKNEELDSDESSDNDEDSEISETGQAAKQKQLKVQHILETDDSSSSEDEEDMELEKYQTQTVNIEKRGEEDVNDSSEDEDEEGTRPPSDKENQGSEEGDVNEMKSKVSVVRARFIFP